MLEKHIKFERNRFSNFCVIFISDLKKVILRRMSLKIQHIFQAKNLYWDHYTQHNIIQMTATAGLSVPHSIKPIFQYIFDCLGFNPMNGNFDFAFQGLNRLWVVSLTPILNGSLQKVAQGGQITAPRFQVTSEFRMIIRFSKTVRKR